MLRRAAHHLVFLSFAAILAMPAKAVDSTASYPNAPVNYVIPFGSGGESDITAQMQQPYFKELTGQDLYISRKPGGGGAVVWNEINSMPGDGYTIVGINLPHIVLQPMLGAQYKTSDIAAVYIFHYTPHAIAVRQDSPFRSLDELLKYARTSSKPLVFSGSGQGTANELAKIHFDKLAGIKTRYQAFKGTGASITALMLETVDASWGYTTAGLNYDDDVRLLAIATEKRHPKLPDVPTFRELGFDLVGGAYRGIAVPKSTPKALRERISDLFAAINQNPKMRRDVENLGFAPIDVPYRDVAKFLDEKSQEYLKLAREAGIVAPVPRPK
ncbi:MAG: tripartite tricarboxylate transporter substrate binding protein [Alphaproteobacteria bacterium]